MHVHFFELSGLFKTISNSQLVEFIAIGTHGYGGHCTPLAPGSNETEKRRRAIVSCF